MEELVRPEEKVDKRFEESDGELQIHEELTPVALTVEVFTTDSEEVPKPDTRNKRKRTSDQSVVVEKNQNVTTKKQKYESSKPPDSPNTKRRLSGNTSTQCGNSDRTLSKSDKSKIKNNSPRKMSQRNESTPTKKSQMERIGKDKTKNARTDKQGKRSAKQGTGEHKNPGDSSDLEGKSSIVESNDEKLALDAEIDHILEEKAARNNLSTINVKSIIYKVITNNLVKKMFIKTIKRDRRRELMEKAIKNGETTCEIDDDDDDDSWLFEPTLTRSKRKELFEKKTSSSGNNEGGQEVASSSNSAVNQSLWPISPVKLQMKGKIQLLGRKPEEDINVNEDDVNVNMLLANDLLPEMEDSEDDEYVPSNLDTSQQSDDDCNSSVASFASDIGSPVPGCSQSSTPTASTSTPKKRNSRSKLALESEEMNVGKTSGEPRCLFKTPEVPIPKAKQQQSQSIDDHAIGLRTRSKLPLNDTPLEHFENQFIPPDITTDMYDWDDTETSNQDYVDFLKSYWNAGPLETSKTCDDDEEEADPEYNVMEDEDDDHHDKEELRDDRAVKIPKKEINELFTELFDGMQDWGQEEFEQMLGLAPLPVNNEREQTSNKSKTSASSSRSAKEPAPVLESASTSVTSVVSPPGDVKQTEGDHEIGSETSEPVGSEPISTSANEGTVSTPAPKESTEQPIISSPFASEQIKLLETQMSQHIQLLAQTFILNDGVDRTTSSHAHHLIRDISNLSCAAGPTSKFSTPNLRPAIMFVKKWLMNRSKSPIKKKILEDSCVNTTAGFPRAIVKAMIESEAFSYMELLPKKFKYNNNDSLDSSRNSARKEYYKKNEDAIMIYELDAIQEKNLTILQQAEYLARILPMEKNVYQIYHRIKNLHKSKNKMFQDYKTKGILPPPPNEKLWNLNVSELLPPVKQYCRSTTSTMSKVWRAMIKSLNPEQIEELRPQNKSTVKSSSRTSSSKPSKNKTEKNKSEHPHKKADSKKEKLPVSIVRPSKRDSTSAKTPVDPKVTRKYEEIIRKTFPIAPRIPSVCYTYPSLVQPPKPEVDVAFSTNDHRTLTIFDMSGKPALQYKVPSYIYEQSNTSTTIDEGRNEELIQEPLNTFRTNSSSPPSNDLWRPVVYLSKQDEENYKPVIFDGEDSGADDDDEISVGNEIRTPSYIPGTPEYFDIASDPDDCDNEKESTIPNSTTDSSLSSDSNDSGSSSSSKENSAMVALKSRQCDGGGDSGKGNQKPKAENSSEAVTSGQQNNLTSGTNSVQTPGDDDDDDKKKRPNRNINNKDLNVCFQDQSQEDNEEEDETKNAEAKKKFLAYTGLDEKKSSTQANNSGRKRKASKSSQQNSWNASTNKSAKRNVKYNTTPMENLLETMDTRSNSDVVDTNRGSNSASNFQAISEDIQTSFVETFINRVRQQVEVENKNPATFTTFVQTLTDFETSETEISQKELFAKVEIVLKDYPDLIRQFTGVLDADVASELGYFADHKQERTYYDFLLLLENWTVNCPQVRAKILHRCRLLREDPNLSKEKVVSAMDSIPNPNPMIITAFKAMFPVYFPPELGFDPNEFEVIELDMDEKPVVPNPTTSQQLDLNETDIDAEIVKLPEEPCPVASSTCPCICHENCTNAQFRNRVRHCNQCCIKFQDGKVFAHSGRIMKPVTVKLTGPETANDIMSGKACATCYKTKVPSDPSPSKSALSPPVHPISTTTNSNATLSTTTATIPKDSVNTPTDLKNSVQSSCKSHPSQIISPSKNSPPKSHSNTQASGNSSAWTRDEDRIILVTYKAEMSWPAAIGKLGPLIPQRTNDEIKERCSYLMKFVT